MFTGIITGLGEIRDTQPLGVTESHGLRVTIGTPADYLADTNLGDSIAINGACMTVTSFDRSAPSFTVDVSAESLQKTAGLNQSGPVNLEKAVRPMDRLGGHLVSGHVDGVGRVKFFSQVGESWRLDVLCPVALAKFIAIKGSVTINGVSLTVNQVADRADGCLVSANLIPHTLQNTALGSLKAGSAVNLEIDLIARYVERMLAQDAS